jgi:hypothetical protein
MAQTIPQRQLHANRDKIILCAKLSQFAYASAIPSKKISVDDDEAREQLYHLLTQLGQQARGIGDRHHGHFARFASKSWWRSHKSQFKWFRSQSYFYHYFDQKDDVNRIVVAFRGTWNDGKESNNWYHEPGRQRLQLWEKMKLTVRSLRPERNTVGTMGAARLVQLALPRVSSVEYRTV